MAAGCHESHGGLPVPTGKRAGAAIRVAAPANAEVFVPSLDDVSADPTREEIFQGEAFFLREAGGVPLEPSQPVVGAP